MHLPAAEWSHRFGFTFRTSSGRGVQTVDEQDLVFSFDTHTKERKGWRNAKRTFRISSNNPHQLASVPTWSVLFCLDVEIFEHDTRNSLQSPGVVDYLLNHVLHCHVFEVATHICQERHVLCHFVDFFYV